MKIDIDEIEMLLIESKADLDIYEILDRSLQKLTD